MRGNTDIRAKTTVAIGKRHGDMCPDGPVLTGWERFEICAEYRPHNLLVN